MLSEFAPYRPFNIMQNTIWNPTTALPCLGCNRPPEKEPVGHAELSGSLFAAPLFSLLLSYIPCDHP